MTLIRKPNLQLKTLLRLGPKKFSFSILILSLFSFQLSSQLLTPANAAQKLPVLQLDGLKGKPLQSVLKSVEASGYAPRAIREADFLFNVTPANYRYVLLPLGAHISDDALAMLNHYLNAGGQLILIPSQEAPDASVYRLYQMIGLPVAGTGHLQEPAHLKWKGLALPSEEQLPADSRILVVLPGVNTSVLATWGSDSPAIVTTPKGAVLNWQWGRQLSPTLNTIALSKVMPLAKPESFILLQQKEEESASPENTRPTSLPNARMLNPSYAPNPRIYAAGKALIALPARPGNPGEPVNEAYSGSNSQRTAETSAGKAAGVSQSRPQAAFQSTTAKPASVPGSTVMVPTASKQGASKSGSGMAAKKPVTAAADPEDEVLNNILGTPVPPSSGDKKDIPAPNPDDPLLKDKLDSVIQAEGETQGAKTTEKKQKHFSFLDPGAEEVLAPDFDYGVYSMNLRVLDNYKRRIQDAIETARQLSMDVPEDKIQALLKEGQLHKRKFESLYLSGQTQLGLDEYALARKSVLQALGLATPSPKVEGRAIWLDRSTIIDSRSPAELKKRMQKLHQAGINIVYFETLNAGFPIYPSTLIKNNPMVQGWDPLKTAIEEGHRLGMEVHAWVWAFAVGNRRHNPLVNQPDDYPGPILSDTGLMSEALRNRDGGLSVDGRQHEFWLSPASTRGREFLLGIYREIVSKYDVDGLQLDYIRYPFQTSSTRMGFEPVGREHFYRSTGASLDNLDDYTSRLWIAWKTYQVSSFVQQVSQTLRGIKPNIKISAAVFPMRRESRIVTIQQDWETWVDNGWVDTLSPMSYTSDPERLQGMFEYVQSSPKKHPLIYPGIALHRLDGGQLVLQLEAIRQKGSLGSTLFAGAHLDNEKIETLANGPYKEQGSMPPHKDVVKSLETILADYQQKFAILKSKNALPKLSPDQIAAIEATLAQVDLALKGIGPVHTLTAIPPFKLQQVQAQLKTLQLNTQAWSEADKADHPFRAQYFQNNMLLMSELLGYLMDRVNGTATAFTAPGKPPVSTTGTAVNPAPNTQPAAHTNGNTKPTTGSVSTGKPTAMTN